METLFRVVSKDVLLSVGSSGEVPAKGFFWLLALDFLFTQSIINCLSTASWRGVWNLIDLSVIHIFGSLNTSNGLFATCFLGVGLNLCCYTLGPVLDRLLSDLPTVFRVLFSRLYTALYFTACMLLWSGFWNLFTFLLPTPLHLVLSVLSASLLLILCGCFNTVNGVPATVSLDTGEDYCTVSTLLQDRDRETGSCCWRTAVRGLDCMATVCLEVLGIQVWQGAETYISSQLPRPPQVTMLVHCLLPLLLGAVIGLLALLVQLLVGFLLERMQGEGRGQYKYRRAAECCISWLGLASSVLHWVAVWHLLDEFFLTQQVVASNIISAGVGVLGLCLLGASRSLHGGLTRDGQENCGLPLQPFYFLAIRAKLGARKCPASERTQLWQKNVIVQLKTNVTQLNNIARVS